MKFYVKGFCAGLVFAALFQLMLFSSSPNVMYLWAALSVGMIIGAGIFWLSSAVDY